MDEAAAETYAPRERRHQKVVRRILEGATEAIVAGGFDALTLTAARFDDLVRRHGAVALGVMRVLAERVRTATQRELALAVSRGAV